MSADVSPPREEESALAAEHALFMRNAFGIVGPSWAEVLDIYGEGVEAVSDQPDKPCDCDDCTNGDDQWCCRVCHDFARSI